MVFRYLLKKRLRTGVLYLVLSMGLIGQVWGQCVAEAGPDTTICAGESVTLGGPQVPGLAYQWTPANGLNDTLAAQPVASPGVTTTYYVTVTDSSGCADVDTVNVVVYPAPSLPDVFNQVSLSATQQDTFWRCNAPGNSAPFTLNLQPNPGSSLNADPGTIFNINYGDGNILSNVTALPQFHTYANPGVYTLSIEAVSPDGCIRTVSYPVINQSFPAGGINSPGSTNGCSPLDLSFTIGNYLINSPGTNYVVNFGDGTVQTWTQSQIEADSGIVNHIFSLSSCVSTFGFYTVGIEITNFCNSLPTTPPPPTTGTVSPVLVYQAPDADFDVLTPVGCIDSVEICLLNTTVPGYDINCTQDTYYEWDFGDGTIVQSNSIQSDSICHIYSTPGTYTITLKAYNDSGCDTTQHQETIRVNDEPLAVIEASDSTGCIPLEVRFDGGDSYGGDLTYAWSVTPATGWQFIPPFHADSVITEIRFLVPGAYTVSLIVSNNCGTDTADYLVVVGGDVALALPPIPNVCDSLPFVYQPLAIIDTAYGTLDTIWWTFAGGNPAFSDQLFPPAVTYTQPGTYTVTVSTITSCGSGTASRQFTLFERPVAAFAAEPVCWGDSTRFDDLSQPGDGAIVQWLWDFGDGDTSMQAEPVHAFDSCGIYLVSLRVIDANGCWRDTSLTVEVFCLPQAAFTSTEVCLGLPTSFTDLSLNGTGIIDTWQWQFGGGIGDTVANPQLVFGSCGLQPVSLTVTDDLGCSSSLNQSAYVLCPPVAAFTSDSVCAGQVSPFTDLSQPGDTTLVSWQWTFGDGNGSSLSSPGHLYAICGLFDVQLIVTDLNGCADTLVQPARVWCQPEPDFTADTACQGVGTNFTHLASPGDAPIVSWVWDFGDGNTQTQSSPQSLIHLYDTCGTYPVTLAVTDANGCTQDMVRSIRVRCLPTVAFQVPAVCVGDSTHFLDQSSSPNGSLTGWSWTFGDGNGSSLANPTHLYGGAGSYLVSLTVTDSAGCVRSGSDSAVVYPLPLVNLVDTPIVLCGQAILDTLSQYLLSANAPGVWSGPAAVTSGWISAADSALGAIDPALLPANGQYTFYYTVTSPFGCQAVDSLTISIIDAQQANAGPDTTLCFDAPLYDLNPPAQPGGGQWSDPNGLVSTGGVFDVAAAGAGSYPVFYTIGSGTCQVTDSLTLTVNPPVVADAGPDSLVFCQGGQV
ncbi:MAG: PKD domain-containing protein, partial [Bacteroidetes bacterium]